MQYRQGQGTEQRTGKAHQKGKDQKETDADLGESITALVLRADAAAHIENHELIKEKYGKTTTRRTGRRVEADSYYRGRAVGDMVNLDRQIEG